MNIKELLSSGSTDEVIEKLKSGRPTSLPDVDTYSGELDPLTHKVFSTTERPDKTIKVDTGDPGVEPVTKTEKVARIALAIQKLIVRRAVSFVFGNSVELDASVEDDKQGEVLVALRRILYDVKSKSLDRRVARHLFSSTEVAELWYPVERKHNTYGFESDIKLRCRVLSPLTGDKLYPYFDSLGDMVAFSREFTIKDSDGEDVRVFETYTDDTIVRWQEGEDGMALVEGFPAVNPLGKIPICYASQEQVEWADVQPLVERLEKLLSNFADTNDYHASPKIFVQGHIKGFAAKGESGAIIEGEEGAKAEYLAWQNAPESVKLEIDTLLRMIYTITQTPDISFEAVRGIGPISGVALKLLFMDAHLKVADHQEVLDEYLQRRINILLAFIGQMNKGLEQAVKDISVEPVIVPYMVVDEAAENKIWQDANGGHPTISIKASFEKAGLTRNPARDYEQYLQEQKEAKSFSVFEPTV